MEIRFHIVHKTPLRLIKGVLFKVTSCQLFRFPRVHAEEYSRCPKSPDPAAQSVLTLSITVDLGLCYRRDYKYENISQNPLYTFTRCYKGPGTEPLDNENNKRLIWEYEELWAEHEGERSDEHPRMQEYVRDVLPLFNEDDGIPNSLKALLYNRYTHWTGGYGLADDVRKFREFLYSHYRSDLKSRP